MPSTGWTRCAPTAPTPTRPPATPRPARPQAGRRLLLVRLPARPRHRHELTGLHRPGVDSDESATTSLSRTEAAAFLAAAGADPRPLWLRTAALLGMLLTEGLRVAECGPPTSPTWATGAGTAPRPWSAMAARKRGYPLASPIAAAIEDCLLDRAGLREGYPFDGWTEVQGGGTTNAPLGAAAFGDRLYIIGLGVK